MTDFAFNASAASASVSSAYAGSARRSRYILWLAANNGFAIIEQAKVFEHADPAIQAGVRAAGTAAGAILNAADVPVINTGDPQVAQLFGLFQLVGLLSATAVQSFMGYGATLKSPAEVAGLPAPSLADVIEARKHGG